MHSSLYPSPSHVAGHFDACSLAFSSLTTALGVAILGGIRLPRDLLATVGSMLAVD